MTMTLQTTTPAGFRGLSPSEQQELRESVARDYACHKANNVDLNPFSTQGSRHEWQLGFEGKPDPLNPNAPTCSRIWMRGAYARELVLANSGT